MDATDVLVLGLVAVVAMVTVLVPVYILWRICRQQAHELAKVTTGLLALSKDSAAQQVAIIHAHAEARAEEPAPLTHPAPARAQHLRAAGSQG